MNAHTHSNTHSAVPFHSIPFSRGFVSNAHDFQKYFRAFFTRAHPNTTFTLYLLPSILFPHTCLYFLWRSFALWGLFITCACMKRRKHEKWRKKLWNRLNSKIKPATSMQCTRWMENKKAACFYQKQIILLLYYTTSAFRKSRYFRPRANITLQFHLIFKHNAVLHRQRFFLYVRFFFSLSRLTV